MGGSNCTSFHRSSWEGIKEELSFGSRGNRHNNDKTSIGQRQKKFEIQKENKKVLPKKKCEIQNTRRVTLIVAVNNHEEAENEARKDGI